jgi:hypothetical protein
MSWLWKNGDLGWSATLIRLAAGGFFLPHVYVKLSGPGTVPVVVGAATAIRKAEI